MAEELPLCDKGFGESFTPFFLPAVIDDPLRGAWYLSEDYAFCERARQVGTPVLTDTRIRLGHAGRFVYGWEDAGSTPPRYDDYFFEVRAGD
jgi:hypothetical protein